MSELLECIVDDDKSFKEIIIDENTELLSNK